MEFVSPQCVQRFNLECLKKTSKHCFLKSLLRGSVLGFSSAFTTPNSSGKGIPLCQMPLPGPEAQSGQQIQRHGVLAAMRGPDLTPVPSTKSSWPCPVTVQSPGRIHNFRPDDALSGRAVCWEVLASFHDRLYEFCARKEVNCFFSQLELTAGLGFLFCFVLVSVLSFPFSYPLPRGWVSLLDQSRERQWSDTPGLPRGLSYVWLSRSQALGAGRSADSDTAKTGSELPKWQV